MQVNDETLIRVHCEWDGWRTAEVRFKDLHNIHWFQPIRAPQPLVHAHVLCTNLMTGEFPHDCPQSSAPHRLRVCILKRHTIPAVYAEFVRCADERRDCAGQAFEARLANAKGSRRGGESRAGREPFRPN